MTNKEILGELKQSYEYINDIDNNEYKQLTNEEKDKITQIEYLLSDIYSGLYERLEKENNEELRVKKLEENDKVYISDDISGDYISVSNDTHYFTYQDTDDYYCWYKDENFLNEYDEGE